MRYGINPEIYKKEPKATSEGCWCWRSAFEGAIDEENMLPAYLYDKLPILFQTYQKKEEVLHKYYMTRSTAVWALKRAIRRHIKEELRDLR